MPQKLVRATEWRLSAQGERDARALAHDPLVAEVERFFTSPEPKCATTARLLAGARPVVPLEELRELDRRALGWLKPGAYEEVVAEILARPEEAVRGCEPAGFAQRRIVRTIDALALSYPGQTLAVVSGGILLTLYLAHVVGRSRALGIWRGIGFPDLAVVDPIRKQVIRHFGAAVAS